MDGATDVEGRVEICFSRRWGTISGNGWTHRESTVVCNDLGYEATGTSVDQNNFTFLIPNICVGQNISVRSATNSMPVYLRDVKCIGCELGILECGFRRHLVQNKLSTDVAVQCKKCK